METLVISYLTIGAMPLLVLIAMVCIVIEFISKTNKKLIDYHTRKEKIRQSKRCPFLRKAYQDKTK